MRKGSDLYMYKNITIGESLGMDIILINLFDKVKFYVNKNKILINPEETMTIIGKGFSDSSKESLALPAIMILF